MFCGMQISIGEVSVGLQTVSARLMKVHAPHPIVGVAEGWPGCLISILSLKLPLFGANFSRAHHQHFKLPTNSRFEGWHTPAPLRE